MSRMKINLEQSASLLLRAEKQGGSQSFCVLAMRKVVIGTYLASSFWGFIFLIRPAKSLWCKNNSMRRRGAKSESRLSKTAADYSGALCLACRTIGSDTTGGGGGGNKTLCFSSTHQSSGQNVNSVGSQKYSGHSAVGTCFPKMPERKTHLNQQMCVLPARLPSAAAERCWRNFWLNLFCVIIFLNPGAN